ncbi:MAG: hypothetical protein ABI574_02680 [Burkholderiales bacterium]
MQNNTPESAEDPTVSGRPLALHNTASQDIPRARYRDALATRSGDETLDAEVLMSTHVAVVVKARVEWTPPLDGETEEVALVIPRRCCEGDLPTVAALVVAARRHAAVMWAAQRSAHHGDRDGRGDGKLAAIRLCTASGLVTLLERLQPTPALWPGAQ